jgi:hypothetical protein
MARGDPVLAQFEAAISAMHPREIQSALQGLAATRPAASPPAGEAGEAGQAGAGPDGLPAPLGELLGTIKAPAAARQLRRLISDARLDQPVAITPGTAARMARPYGWLLDRVGPGGLKLTDAGHLPPAHVQAAVAELGLAGQCGDTGGGAGARASRRAGRRENRTLPVRHLRESAVSMGLLRKERGRLLLTARGSAVRAHPVALWWHLAERMPVPSAVTCEVRAGLILLTCVAARFTDTLDETTGRLLAAMGWTSPGGTPLTGAAAAGAAWNTRTVLRRLGAFSGAPGRDHAARPTADGVTFARAALVSWPGRPPTGREGATPPPSAAGRG